MDGREEDKRARRARLARILGDLPDLREVKHEPHRDRRAHHNRRQVIVASIVIVACFVFLALARSGADSATTLTMVPPVVSNQSRSVAKSAPAAKGTDTVQSPRPSTGTNILVPSAGAGTATIRTALSAAEKATVARGLRELKNTDAINAPRRPTRNRSALTEEEKAAVERGLRELEKRG